MLDHVNSKYFKLAVGKLKKETPEELVACCPQCGDKRYRLHLYNTEVGDLVHCFNDGCELSDKHHTMKNFLEVIGSGNLASYKRESLHQKIDEIKNEESLQDILNRAKERTKEPKKTLEKEIPLHRLFDKAKDSEECTKYLKDRAIEPEDDWFFSTNKFFEHNGKKVYLENYLLIPIYNENYKYRGFYSRSIKEKSFSTFLLDDTEKIWRAFPEKYPEIVCEGIFDALSTGFDNCAAMLSASVSQEYRDSLPKSTIFAFDNDKTGYKRSLEYLQLGFNVFVWPDLEEKDFNEMLVNGYKKNEIKNIIQKNTYSGIIGETRLRMKER